MSLEDQSQIVVEEEHQNPKFQLTSPMFIHLDPKKHIEFINEHPKGYKQQWKSGCYKQRIRPFTQEDEWLKPGCVTLAIGGRSKDSEDDVWEMKHTPKEYIPMAHEGFFDNGKGDFEIKDGKCEMLADVGIWSPELGAIVHEGGFSIIFEYTRNTPPIVTEKQAQKDAETMKRLFLEYSERAKQEGLRLEEENKREVARDNATQQQSVE